jgi:serine/threonine protein kinase
MSAKSKKPRLATVDGVDGLVSPPRVCGVYRDIGLDYTIGAELGHGKYGIVMNATRKADGREFAAKKIAVSHLTDPGTVSREITMMRSLAHPNILEVVDTYEWRQVRARSDRIARISATRTFAVRSHADTSRALSRSRLLVLACSLCAANER